MENEGGGNLLDVVLNNAEPAPKQEIVPPTAETPKEETAPKVQEEVVAEQPKETSVEETPVKEVETPSAVEEPAKEEPSAPELINLLGDESSPESTSLDYAAFAKELGVSGETKEEILSGLNKGVEIQDDEFKEVFDLQQKGGDWKSYLQTQAIDVDSMPDDVILQHQYGQIIKDQEKLNDLIDQMDEGQKALEAGKIRQDLNMQKEQRLNDLRQKQDLESAKQQRQEFEQSVKDTVNGMDTFLEKYQVTDSMKRQAVKDLTSMVELPSGQQVSKFISDIMFDKKGNIDTSKLVSAYLSSKHAESISKYFLSKGKNEAVKETFDKLQNTDLPGKTTTEAHNAPNPSLYGAVAADLDNLNQNYLNKS
jgi:hypothetical protein